MKRKETDGRVEIMGRMEFSSAKECTGGITTDPEQISFCIGFAGDRDLKNYTPEQVYRILGVGLKTEEQEHSSCGYGGNLYEVYKFSNGMFGVTRYWSACASYSDQPVDQLIIADSLGHLHMFALTDDAREVWRETHARFLQFQAALPQDFPHTIVFLIGEYTKLPDYISP